MNSRARAARQTEVCAVNFDRQMLRLNRRDDGNGLDQSREDTEKRLISTTLRMASWAKWLVGTTLIAAGSWFALSAKVTALEKDVAVLTETKQSKEAAEGDQRVILLEIRLLKDVVETRLRAVEAQIEQKRGR